MCSNAERIDGGGCIRSGLVARFVADDGAQDLVEYALLAAFIGIAGWAILMALPQAMQDTYKSWVDPDAATSVPGQWDTPEPAGS